MHPFHLARIIVSFLICYPWFYGTIWRYTQFQSYPPSVGQTAAVQQCPQNPHSPTLASAIFVSSHSSGGLPRTLQQQKKLQCMPYFLRYHQNLSHYLHARRLSITTLSGEAFLTRLLKSYGSVLSQVLKGRGTEVGSSSKFHIF